MKKKSERQITREWLESQEFHFGPPKEMVSSPTKKRETQAQLIKKADAAVGEVED